MKPSDAMLARMRKVVAVAIAFLFLLHDSFGQAPTKIPKLQELDQSNRIALHRTQIAPLQLELLKRLTAKIITACVSDPGLDDPQTAEKTFAQLQVARITINEKHDTALITQGNGACMCGAVGNCPVWILSDRPQPTLLLKAISVQTFAVQKSGTKPSYDLVLGTHSSATETYLHWFRFGGTRYRSLRCGIANWNDRNGNPLNSPRFSVSPCR